MSEPRLHIRNLASTNLLYYDGHWRAGTIGEEHAGERHVKYKVQWCEKLGDFAKTVLIRTDKHPQKLLDATNLDFQGGIAYDGKKNDKARWWKVTYIEVSENSATVLFQSYRSGAYLAEKDDRSGVELIEIDGDTLTQDIPTRAQWGLTIGGHALTPGEVVFVSVAPLIFAMGAITGGAATSAFAAALTLAGVVDLSGTAVFAVTVAVGAAIGGISAETSAVIANVLKEVTDKMFVDW